MYVWLSKVNQITQGGIIIIIYYLTINNIPRFAFNDLLTFKTWPIWFQLNNINKSQQNISVV